MINVELVEVEESKVFNVESQIHQLLSLYYSEISKDQTFYKQLAHFRLLAFQNDVLIGHISVYLRMISIGETALKIYGLSDVCVHGDFRNQGIATLMINEIVKMANNRNIEALLLVAYEEKFYKNFGFESLKRRTKWLVIQNNMTVGVVNRRFNEGLMLKMCKKNKSTPQGDVDLLGTIM